MYTFIYIYIYMHAHNVRMACIHMGIWDVSVYMHRCLCTHMIYHAYIYVYTHICIPIYINIRIHVFISVCDNTDVRNQLFLLSPVTCTRVLLFQSWHCHTIFCLTLWCWCSFSCAVWLGLFLSLFFKPPIPGDYPLSLTPDKGLWASPWFKRCIRNTYN